MMSSILLPLLVMGVLGIFTAMVTSGVASKRLRIIPLVGGIVLFGLIAVGLLASLGVGLSHHVVTVHTPPSIQVIGGANGTTQTVVHSPPNFNASNPLFA